MLYFADGSTPTEQLPFSLIRNHGEIFRRLLDIKYLDLTLPDDVYHSFIFSELIIPNFWC